MLNGIVDPRPASETLAPEAPEALIRHACLAACLLVATACASNPPPAPDVLERIRRFGETREAATAELSAELKFLTDAALRGTYWNPTPDTLVYSISNDTLDVHLEQMGRDVYLSVAAGLVHLTMDDVTDSEYALLRVVIGPLGLPILSARQMAPTIDRFLRLIGTRREGWMGDDILVAEPNPEYREALRLMVNFQVGAAGRALDSVAPDTWLIYVTRGAGQVRRLVQLNALGEQVAELRLKYSDGAQGADPVRLTRLAGSGRRPPPAGRAMGTRELMMALGAGPAWLIGKSTPDARLIQMDGRMVSMSHLRGRPMLINFWATWCAPCRIEWPVLQELYDKHGKDVSFLMLTNEDHTVVRAYLQANGYRAPVYLAADNSLLAGFGVRSLPSTFFVDSAGMIRGVFIGFPARSTIEETRADLKTKYDQVLSDLRLSSGQ